MLYQHDTWQALSISVYGDWRQQQKGLAKPSMVLAEQLDTCDKICVIRYLGRVSKGQMRGIDEAVRIQLGYYIPEQAEKKRQGKCRKDGEEGDG